MNISSMEDLEIQNQYSKNEKINELYKTLFRSFEKLAKILRNSPRGGNYLKSYNVFGDHQLDTDIDCEETIIQELKKCGLIKYVLTEENPTPIDIGGSDFIICFDPLDGSSIIGSNFTIGSVYAIWPYDEKILIGKTGRDIVAAGVTLYGSRTTALITCDGRVNEYTLIKNKNNKKKEWNLSFENLVIDKKAKTFAPGNLRAVTEHKEYKELLDSWISDKYTLRYTGGMVPDIYQIFIRGEGIFTNLSSKSNPQKLRLLYEVFPLAKLVEDAGGRTTNGKLSIIETVIMNYDQKSDICVGSEEEIEKIEKLLAKY